MSQLNLAETLPRITVYCGSSPGAQEIYQTQARAMGILLAQENIQLIYGGGALGLMGTLADACLENGGRVTGVIPDFMVDLEWAHKGIQDLRLVPSMSERKKLLLELGSGLLALPGGIGTLEELSEVLSWSQLRLHRKPIGLLNVDHYFDPLLDFLRKMIHEGFCPQNTLDLLLVSEEPEDLLEKMAHFHHHGQLKTINH